MKRYDPEIPPAPQAWLALDEQERLHLVEAYHRAAHIQLPNVTLHAVFHTIIENQLAEGLESAVRAMARLANEGLSRHEAIHAVSCVCAEHLSETLRSADPSQAGTLQARYDANLEHLSAKSWRKQFGG